MGKDLANLMLQIFFAGGIYINKVKPAFSLYSFPPP